MWIRITDISIKQVEPHQLKNPKNPGNPIVLDIFQREGRTVFHVSKNKKVYSQFLEKPSGKRIPKRKWTDDMKAFARQELENIPPQKTQFKITVFGWLFLLLAFATLGYLTYKGIQAPAKAEQYQQELTEKATVSEGEIYFGNYRIYKEKGNVIGSKGGFCWLKVVNIEDHTYHIAKSVEVSDTARPKEDLNSTDFEEESFTVKAKDLEAYHKTFASGDGLIEITISEKKEK